MYILGQFLSYCVSPTVKYSTFVLYRYGKCGNDHDDEKIGDVSSVRILYWCNVNVSVLTTVHMGHTVFVLYAM